MLVSKLTEKFQTTIPVDVRHFLDLHKGDRVAFEIKQSAVILKKVKPLDYEYMQSLGGTLSEWSSVEDDEAYRDL